MSKLKASISSLHALRLAPLKVQPPTQSKDMSFGIVSVGVKGCFCLSCPVTNQPRIYHDPKYRTLIECMCCLFAYCRWSTEIAMRNCQRAQKSSRRPDLNADFARNPAFHQREYGTAEWLQVTRVQPRNCDQGCTVWQQVRSVAFDARPPSRHSQKNKNK